MSTFPAHENAKTQFIEAGGIRYANRRIGRAGRPPLVFCHRFRGTMDDWDPAVVNGFARQREVILFDAFRTLGGGWSFRQAGVSKSDQAANSTSQGDGKEQGSAR